MSRTLREAVILGPVRTPIGSFLGALAAVPAVRLGAAAVAEAVRRVGLGTEAEPVPQLTRRRGHLAVVADPD